MKILFPICALVALLLLAISPDSTLGQESDDLDWSYPVQIPQYHKDSRPPVLIADDNNQIHGFTVDTHNGNSAIEYRRWTREVGWSIPVDVVLPPRQGTAKIMGVVIDDNDYLHLVAFYGDIFGAGLYHISAPLATIDSALTWGELQLINDSPGPLAEGLLIGDGQDYLHVVFQGGSSGLGLYEVFSEDRGKTWSSPNILYLSSNADALPSAVDTHIGEDGAVHAVWSIWDAQLGVGNELFYSKRGRQIDSWSTPTLIANRTGREYESDWGAITSFEDELLILYQDSFPAAKFMRRSTDNGDSWTQPERPWPHIGEYENAVFLKDGVGRLHTILGNRDGDCCHGMWHAMYVDGQWQELESIIEGPKTIDFDPSAPDAVISQGNLIMATWWMDSKDRNGAWFSYAIIDDVDVSETTPYKPPVVIEEENDDESNNLNEEVTGLAIDIPDDWKVEEPANPASSAMVFGIVIGLVSILLSFLFWQFFLKNR